MAMVVVVVLAFAAAGMVLVGRVVSTGSSTGSVRENGPRMFAASDRT
ncbi:hypothetical protein [Frankia sp. ACN1ag]|nr:hypothetical protein [Frankia sp. ACN1ag]